MLEQVFIKIAYLPNLDSPQVLFLFIVVYFFFQLFWLSSCLYKQDLHVVNDCELALHLEEIIFGKNKAFYRKTNENIPREMGNISTCLNGRNGRKMQIQKNCKQMSVNRKLQHETATGIVSNRIFILTKHFILIGINV